MLSEVQPASGRRYNLASLGKKGKGRNKGSAIKPKVATEHSASLSLGKDGFGK